MAAHMNLIPVASAGVCAQSIRHLGNSSEGARDIQVLFQQLYHCLQHSSSSTVVTAGPHSLLAWSWQHQLPSGTQDPGFPFSPGFIWKVVQKDSPRHHRCCSQGCQEASAHRLPSLRPPSLSSLPCSFEPHAPEDLGQLSLVELREVSKEFLCAALVLLGATEENR
ncbi:hypothetical protein QTO34_016623 [Cnephaeus nilssonii]|uniref:Uncharacterized protein n=1 Tax=Cnephaeus nilssonii TaxID=3371016 RepID=A0AA40I2J8_CNENI|nr:hypothetical protein QTO34_016623 [Eptesicus nilssonii]